MATLLITILVLIALLAVLDRALAAAIAAQIGERLATANDLPMRPSVHVLGFPFLTQLAFGDYHEVSVTLGSVSAGGVELSELDVRFTGVHASLRKIFWPGRSDITAEHASATALVPLAVLSQRLPPGLTLSQAGSQLRIISTVLGVPVPGILALSVSADGITITPRISGVPALVGFVIPLRALPLRLAVTAVSVTEQGLRVSAAGQNVRLAAARPDGSAGPG
jgi:LmeA-like phospholipid-binding